MATRRLATRPRIEPLEERSLLNAGGLDTGFGGTGIVVTKVNSFSGGAKGVAVQPDLKTVVVGTSSDGSSPSNPNNTGVTDVTVVRYNQDGSLDTTFGASGIVNIPCFPNPGGLNVQCIQIQQDGKIVIGAENYTSYGTKKTQVWRNDLIVERLNPNGSIDTTFNGNGRATFDLPTKSLFAAGLAIQPDGKIVIGAGSGTIASGAGFVAVRFNSNGTLDTSFGPGGKGYVAASSGSAVCLALDASGDVVMGGHDVNPATGAMAPALVRFTPSGQPDGSFGTQGETFLNLGGGIPGVAAVAFQSTGRILASVNWNGSGTGYSARLIRLNADGSVDGSFGTNGYFSDGAMAWPSGLAVQSDGKIIMAGTPSVAAHAEPATFFVDRILPDGQALDSSFGAGGRSQAVIPGSNSTSAQSPTVIGPDGKITVVGSYVPPLPANQSSRLFEVVRLLGDAPASQTARTSAASSPTAASARSTSMEGVAPSLPSSTGRAVERGLHRPGFLSTNSVRAGAAPSYARQSAPPSGSGWGSVVSSKRFA